VFVTAVSKYKSHVSDRTFAENRCVAYTIFRGNKQRFLHFLIGGIHMKYKDEKRYLTVAKEEIGKYINYLMIARNRYIEEGKPIDDVNELLLKFMKLRKKLRAYMLKDDYDKLLTDLEPYTRPPAWAG